MYPQKKLELVHFQLTRNCNLRCPFCGQWGEKGFFSNACGEDMTLSDWKSIADELAENRIKTGENPSVMLWGGEPLVFPQFREIAEYLAKNGFELGIVTNGVFINKYHDILKRDFKKIYISVDGPREIHDSIRGSGVFDRVAENIGMIKDGNAEIIIMTVLTEALFAKIEELPTAFETLSPSKVLLQDMIYLTAEETAAYAKWLKNCFGTEAHDIYAWQMQPSRDYDKQKAAALEKLERLGGNIRFIHMRHGENAEREYCLSPFRHAHVTWNGNVMYCTDHYDFGAGNVKNDSLIHIFNNELSEKFRHEIFNGSCAACSHCSWKNNSSFCL